jgi:hypothetical protein
MAGGGDTQNKALRDWLSRVMADHRSVPDCADCQCGWTAPAGTDPGDQEPWLEHRTDVILDVLDSTTDLRTDDEIEWERLAAEIRRREAR